MNSTNGGRPRRVRGRWSARALVVVINGMLIGVGGVFVATASIPVTVTAAAAAVAISIVIVVAHR